MVKIHLKMGSVLGVSYTGNQIIILVHELQEHHHVILLILAN